MPCRFSQTLHRAVLTPLLDKRGNTWPTWSCVSQTNYPSVVRNKSKVSGKLRATQGRKLHPMPRMKSTSKNHPCQTRRLGRRARAALFVFVLGKRKAISPSSVSQNLNKAAPNPLLGKHGNTCRHHHACSAHPNTMHKASRKSHPCKSHGQQRKRGACDATP